MGPGRPTLGSWVVYGLGSENQNLPAYVVLDDPLGLPVNGVENWQAGFLPPIFQGTRFRSTGSPVLNLRPDVERPADVVQTERDLLRRLDAAAQAAAAGPAQPRRPHRQLRTGRPHATGGDRRPRHFARKARRRWTMYGVGPGADRLLRPPLPDRPPAGRARRALRAALHQRPDLGQPHRAGRRPQGGLRPHRSADRRPAARPEAARAARQHAGRLGRRVRPAADRPAAAGQGRAARPAATTTRTPSAPGWPAPASRAARPTAPPTNSAWPPSRTASACPTGTRPSCTCSACTTTSSSSNRTA